MKRRYTLNFGRNGYSFTNTICLFVSSRNRNIVFTCTSSSRYSFVNRWNIFNFSRNGYSITKINISCNDNSWRCVWILSYPRFFRNATYCIVNSWRCVWLLRYTRFSRNGIYCIVTSVMFFIILYRYSNF